MECGVCRKPGKTCCMCGGEYCSTCKKEHHCWESVGEFSYSSVRRLRILEGTIYLSEVVGEGGGVGTHMIFVPKREER